MNVHPRQALEASHWEQAVKAQEKATDADAETWLPGWRVQLAGKSGYWSDAEFAAAFVPAERLDALIEAAREVALEPCDHHHGIKAEPEKPTYCFTLHERCPCALDDLRAALHAYDEGQEQ